RLVATTDRAFALVAKRGAFAQWVRTGLVPRVLPPLFHLSRVRRGAFRAVSQIAISYRHSPLSAGKAGPLRGGDRLPWVETAAAQDNFAALASLNWQVHIYGRARPDVAEACDALRVPLHTFSWSPPMRRAGLVHGALYLIRPDGYLALADAHTDPA